MMNEKYDLERFTIAHNDSFAQALAEIKRGRKTSHWMWYFFPQIAGLGRSSTAQYYAIADVNEAKAFLDDSYLGGNLVEISSALLELDCDDPIQVFGWIDAVKLKSSMTLFEMAEKMSGAIKADNAVGSGMSETAEHIGDKSVSENEDDNVYGKVLEKFFGGERDVATIRIVSGQR